jgi:hypothetical protein
MERGEAQLKKEYLDPAMAQIAQEIDSRAALWAYQNANNIVGVLGTDPTSTFDATSAAGAAASRRARCPPSGERAVRPPNVMRALKVPRCVAVLQPGHRHRQAVPEGTVGSGDGFEWYESMSLYSHTAGTWAGAVTVTARRTARPRFA